MSRSHDWYFLQLTGRGGAACGKIGNNYVVAGGSDGGMFYIYKPVTLTNTFNDWRVWCIGV